MKRFRRWLGNLFLVCATPLLPFVFTFRHVGRAVPRIERAIKGRYQ